MFIKIICEGLQIVLKLIKVHNMKEIKVHSELIHTVDKQEERGAD